MQVTSDELKHQQVVLKHLGFYKGKIDGIWSESTIAAKRNYEFKIEFSPAIPNNGLPFGLNDRLPANLVFKRVGNTALLHHVALTDEDVSRIIGNTPTTIAVKDPVVEAGPTVAEAPQVEPAPVAPVVPAPVVQNQQNQHNPNKHNPNKNHNQR